jgi:hypothetical protein
VPETVALAGPQIRATFVGDASLRGALADPAPQPLSMPSSQALRPTQMWLGPRRVDVITRSSIGSASVEPWNDIAGQP